MVPVNARLVGHTEVIPERHSLAAESEFSSEIAASNARHRIALRPSPVKSGGLNGSMQHSPEVLSAGVSVAKFVRER